MVNPFSFSKTQMRSHETVHVVASAVILYTTGALSYSTFPRKLFRPTAFISLESPNSSRRWMHSSISRFDSRRQRQCSDADTPQFDRRNPVYGIQNLICSSVHNSYKPRKLCVAPMMDWTDRFDRYFLRVMSKHTWLYTEMVTTGAIIFGDQVLFACLKN